MACRSATALLGATVALAGCDADVGSSAFQERDSAGIQIVENYRPDWDSGEEWKVGAEAILRLGVVDGDPAFQFDGVTGLARMEDGTIVVADGGFQEVRFFDSEGLHSGTFGGPGEGPREFSFLAGLGLGGAGLIWAYDFSLRRITWLDAHGEMVSLTSLGPEPAMLQPLGALPDGTFLLKQLWGASQVAEAAETGLRRDAVAYVHFDAEGSLVDTLGLFPGRELFLTDENGRGVMSTPPFPRNSVGAVWGGVMVEGSNETFELVVHTPEGGVGTIIRLPDLDLTLGPDAREEYILGRQELAAPERWPGIRAEIESMPFPEKRPAYGSLLPDDLGNLWVGDWVLFPEVAKGWKVLDPSGRWMGEMTMPERFFPYAVGVDWILGVEWDELDVEYVVLYPLIKEEETG